MNDLIQNKHKAYFGAGIALVIAVGFSVWALMARYEHGTWLVTAFEKRARAVELVNSMRTNLLVSTDAEKSAVMADTDEESQTFAQQSAKASSVVEESRRDLVKLLDEKKTGGEMELLQNFSSCWEKLQQVDREILPLAVQNTNLKAMRLSFVPAAEAIRRMQTALDRLMDAEASLAEALTITRLVSRAMVDALYIHALQAPHIAETSISKMDEMEKTMKIRDERVEQSFAKLNGLVDETGRPYLLAATAAYNDFRKINAQIIDLSRQNSNIRSFEISLGRKRTVTAQCMDSLTALEKAVREGSSFRATR